ncbi:putative beta-carotene-binding protein [Diachasma alloeum]|uniref:putative beta-carotene-binding protein n=1 Tax=Diachasma alloeum TaxID=454923 RepID=UPI000738109A|nr:putative beta-carotene-binding protein [Diachasma alloeum]
MEKIILLCANVILLSGWTLGEVPSYITVCGRKNSNLNECVRNSVESLRGKIAEGMPELDVPSVEPFFLPEGLPLVDSPDIKAYARNVKLYGIPNFVLDNLNVDLDKQQIDLQVHFEKLRLQGDYDVAAKIVVPINAKGPVEIETSGVSGQAVLKYQIVNTKKGRRMYFNTMSLKLDIKDYVSKFVPTGGPDVTFGEAINAVLNSNRQEIISGIQPSLEKSISAKILELANKICKNFTFEELFPDRE